MKHNKHKDDSRPPGVVTKSKKYWAGATRSKPKHGCRKINRPLLYCDNRIECRKRRIVQLQLDIYRYYTLDASRFVLDESRDFFRN